MAIAIVEGKITNPFPASITAQIVNGRLDFYGLPSVPVLTPPEPEVIRLTSSLNRIIAKESKLN